jgi:uncharacterized membrane protein (DUF485 family)
MKLFFAALLSLSLFMPVFVSAQNPLDQLRTFDTGLRGGLCEGVKDEGGTLSLGCQLCNLIQLANKLIQFMTAFAFGIAVIFFLYAGYLIMWGGVSGESLTRGKSIARGTVIGLIIVLASWVVINTIFQTLVNQGVGKGFVPPWQEIRC